MIDKGIQKIIDGELTRKGRAIHSIMEMLGFNDLAYQAFLADMTEEERSTYDAEVDRYMEVCTIMSGEYLQWSSQLLVAAPEGVESESAYQSSLIAPMGIVLLDTLKQNSGKPIPQHLRSAAAQVNKLAKAKKRFLIELFKQLRADEKEAYGDLLEVCDPFMSAMPDLPLYETYQRLNLAWKFRSQLLVKPQVGVPEDKIVASVANINQRVTELSSKALQPLLIASSVQTQDSLAAKLLLASMVNRTHWEMLEFERLEQVATQSLLKLIRGLQKIGNRFVPASLDREAFEQWLIKHFSNDTFPGEDKWRALKTQHLNRFYSQATWILQWEKLDFVEHDENERILLNMCALHLVWSYCTCEKHDLRVPDIKALDLVNGREIESIDQVPLTRIMYQQRQLNTMLNSHQHYELNAKKLETYTECNRSGRRQLMQYIRSNLRNVSLAQWKSLTRDVWKLLAPLLMK